MENIKTLFCIKMEKNFIAQEKGYPRKPYDEYTLMFLMQRLQEEVDELRFAVFTQDFQDARLECADVSNITDYIFEKLAQKEG